MKKKDYLILINETLKNDIKSCSKSIYLLLYIILHITINTGYSQNKNYEFERIGMKKGLSQNTIEGILQDDKGFMWFATQNGLNKFDGYKFTIYFNSISDSNSISSSNIRTIFKDTEGDIWIGFNGGGLDRYIKEKDTFEHYSILDKRLNTITIYSIIESRNGNLWFGTETGVYCFNKKKNSIKYYENESNNPNSLTHNYVMKIVESQKTDENILWIGTRGGLSKFNIDTENFTNYKHNSKKNSLPNNIVKDILEDSLGNIWVGTRGGLSILNPISETFINYNFSKNNSNTLPDNRINVIYKDADGILWIGTHNGLSYLDYEGAISDNYKNLRFTTLKKENYNSKSISNNRVASIYEDKNGILWFGTYFGGVNKLDKNRNKFITNNIAYYKKNKNFNQFPNSDIIRAICKDEKEIVWIGTTMGLSKLDRKNNTIVNYTHDPNDPNNAKSLGGNSVRSLFIDHKKQLWVGTNDGGLDMFIKETNSFVHYKPEPNNPNSISGIDIRAIYEDSDSILWIGTNLNGLNRFDRKNNKFTCYKPTPNPNSISNISITSIKEDSNDKLWVSTWNGLNVFDKKTKKFKRFLNKNKDINGLANNSIKCVYPDKSGNIWIGTAGNGLNKLKNAKGEKFDLFGLKEGLPNGYIYSILEDKKGNLWMSTNKGISKFNIQSETFKNYDFGDGLQGDEFNTGAYFKHSDGEMFFGGINGFNAFYPHEILDNMFKPDIALTDFKILNNSIKIKDKNKNTKSPLLQHISLAKHIILTYQDRVFSFEFASLHYTDPKRNLYAYKLDGFDSKWNYTNSDRRFATYTNLPAGDYTFKVKASNNDYVWNEKGYSINLTILPPWWKSWWAYSLYVISVLTLIICSIRIQNKKLQQKQKDLEKEQEVARKLENANQKLKDANQLKDDFLANTSHELRTPLNGIIGLAESLIDGATGILPENTNLNLQMIVTSGKRLSNLVNDILDFSKIKRKELNLNIKPVDIHNIALMVIALSKPLIFGKNIKIINKVFSFLPLVEGDEDRVQQILLNLIGNAIKFSESGEIVLKAKEEVDKLSNSPFMTISVSDNGIGIAKEKFEEIFQSFEQLESNNSREYSGTGLGLAVTKQLVELQNGKIWLESDEGKGSTFYFTLPISKELQINKPVEKEAFKSEDSITSYTEAILKQIKKKVQTSEEYIDLNEYSLTAKKEGNLNILVVDDEPINLQVLENHLSLQNYSVIRAHSGIEALNILKEREDLDLVVLDVMMPKMSGYEVCEKIRELFPPNQLPVILLTAKNRVVDIVAGFQAGANDYLTKPFTKGELLSRVKTHIELLKATKELESAYNQLLKAHKQLDIFTYRTAHDLKGPLARLLGLCYVSLIEVNDPVAVNYLKKLESEANELNSLLSKLLKANEIRAKEIVLSKIDFKDVINNIIIELSEKHNTKNFNFDVIVPNDFMFNSDLELITILLRNVFKNTVIFKSNIDSPKVTITVIKSSDKHIKIKIQDNGIGIFKEVKHKIFDMFVVGVDNAKGVGLGLFEARIITDKLKGNIWLENSKPGNTEFIIELPKLN